MNLIKLKRISTGHLYISNELGNTNLVSTIGNTMHGKLNVSIDAKYTNRWTILNYIIDPLVTLSLREKYKTHCLLSNIFTLYSDF